MLVDSKVVPVISAEEPPVKIGYYVRNAEKQCRLAGISGITTLSTNIFRYLEMSETV